MATSDWQPDEIDDTAPEIPELYEEDPTEFDDRVEVIEEIERGLGFTDGFQFGCGFWTAALVVGIVAGLIFLILAFFLSFAGINLLG